MTIFQQKLINFEAIPEMRENKDGESDGDEGDAVADNFHHPGEVKDEHFPFHIGI